jgi:hypothetical protein
LQIKKVLFVSPSLCVSQEVSLGQFMKDTRNCLLWDAGGARQLTGGMCSRIVFREGHKNQYPNMGDITQYCSNIVIHHFWTF